MQRLVFSTAGVPEREQFERWRELGERHLLSPRWERGGPSGAPFHGAMTVRQLGEARFVDLRSQPHRVLSGQAEAARAAAGVCVV